MSLKRALPVSRITRPDLAVIPAEIPNGTDRGKDRGKEAEDETDHDHPQQGTANIAVLEQCHQKRGALMQLAVRILDIDGI